MSKHVSAKAIVLYADDDVDDLLLVKDAFSKYSDRLEVVTVFDGTQVLSFLNGLSTFEPSPCLIILDVNMPRMNGKETLKEIRKLSRFADTPVVFFTTSALPSDEAFASRYQAGFMTKPLNVRHIELVVHQFAEHCTDEIKRILNWKIESQIEKE